jgi:outer membrane receptor for ferrienterochelin and colicins
MPLQMANIVLKNTKINHHYCKRFLSFWWCSNGKLWNYRTYTGFKSQTQRITITDTTIILDFNLRDDTTLDEIVITGTLKPVSRMESPVPVSL